MSNIHQSSLFFIKATGISAGAWVLSTMICAAGSWGPCGPVNTIAGVGMLALLASTACTLLALAFALVSFTAEFISGRVNS